MDLRIKRAELLDKLSKLQQDHGTGMTAAISREFTNMLDDVDKITNEIRFNDYANQAGTTDGAMDNIVNYSAPYYQAAAKKTLGDAFRMLATGERSKLDNNFLTELGEKHG